MRKLSGYLFTLLLLAVVFDARSQSASTMRFDYEVWDFGRIAESDGKVTHTFEFTNTGTKAFVIEHISVSCGCTTPEFTKQPIKPGEKGKMIVTYDPHNRPGVFLQSVQIKSNGGRNNNTIKIKGEVIPRPRTAEESYPFSTRSGVRFNTMSLNYRYLEPNTTREMKVGYVNTTGKEVAFSYDITPANKYLEVDAPDKICAGCAGEITVRYNVGEGVYGRFGDRIYPIVDGRREPLPFTTTAIAVDKMTGVDESNAARAEADPLFNNFGDVQKGTVVRKEFTLTNTGKSPLIVRWTGVRDYVKTSLKEGTVIQPGRAVRFEISMDTSSANSGVLTGSLVFIVNDPVRPMREIRVSANVK